MGISLSETSVLSDILRSFWEYSSDYFERGYGYEHQSEQGEEPRRAYGWGSYHPEHSEDYRYQGDQNPVHLPYHEPPYEEGPLKDVMKGRDITCFLFPAYCSIGVIYKKYK